MRSLARLGRKVYALIKKGNLKDYKVNEHLPLSLGVVL